jgi:hypothetical protein
MARPEGGKWPRCTAAIVSILARRFTRDGVAKARFVDPDFRRRMAVEELIGPLKAAG